MPVCYKCGNVYENVYIRQNRQLCHGCFVKEWGKEPYPPDNCVLFISIVETPHPSKKLVVSEIKILKLRVKKDNENVEM